MNTKLYYKKSDIHTLEVTKIFTYYLTKIDYYSFDNTLLAILRTLYKSSIGREHALSI